MSTRILVVDDKEENLYLLERLLGGNGYVTERAVNGAEALEKAIATPPDMIITDILMPVMDGFELCRRWKRHDVLRKIPFVFYTATYTDPKDEEFAMRLGADVFIVKPEEPGTFLLTIRNALSLMREGALTPPSEPAAGETVQLREYNEALVRKLEDKMAQLESSNRSLAERESRLNAIAANAPVLIVKLDPEGIVSFTNDALPMLRGRVVPGLSVFDAVPPAAGDRIRDYIRRRDAAGSTDEFDVTDVASPGGHVRLRIRIGPLRAEGNRGGFIVVVSDETALLASEEELRRATRYTRVVLDTALDGYILADENGRIMDVNGAYCALSGYTAEELRGMNIADLDAKYAAAELPAQIARMIASGSARFETVHRAKDGRPIDIEVSFTVVRDEGRTMVAAFVRDITTRKEADLKVRESRDRLRDLSRHLQEARESERLMISREIHDDFGQALTGMKIDLHWLRQKLPDSVRIPGREEFVRKLDDLIGLADSTIATVRRLAAGLRPSLLDDLGLADALEALVRDFSRRTGIAGEFSGPDPGREEPEKSQAIHIFRIVQESLTNVARHAVARSVRVTMRTGEGTVLVTVEDDGRGFPGGDQKAAAALGVLGMRERASMIGGDLEIGRGERGGTSVGVRAPLRTPEPGRGAGA